MDVTTDESGRRHWRLPAAMFAAGCGILCLAGFTRSPATSPLNWSLAQWVEWRDGEIERMLEPTLVHGGEKILSRQAVIDRSVEPYGVVSDCLNADPGFFSPSQPRGKAMAHFVDFVATQRLMTVAEAGRPTHQLGYDVSDGDYVLRSADRLSFPSLFSSQPFLKALANPATYKRALDLIEENNASLPEDRKWIVLPFTSGFIKSVDRTTFGRFLVLAPNEPIDGRKVIDRWVMFGIVTPDMPVDSHVRSVSMIAVEHARGEASEGPTVGQDAPARAWMMDYLRVTGSRGEVTLAPTPSLPVNPSNTCYDCHKTAVIPIRPEVVYTVDSSGNLRPGNVAAVADSMNRRIARYGHPVQAIEEESYGPTIGPAGRARSDQFIRETAGSAMPDASVARIREAMNCASCHDSIGRVNYPMAAHTSRDVLAFKTDHGLVESYIEKGWMPPNNSLTGQERRALWLCLSREYFDPTRRTGVLVDWLRGQ